MSTALQKHEAHVLMRQENGIHIRALSALFPLWQYSSGKKKVLFSKSQLPERSYPVNELKIQGHVSCEAEGKATGWFYSQYFVYV